MDVPKLFIFAADLYPAPPAWLRNPDAFQDLSETRITTEHFERDDASINRGMELAKPNNTSWNQGGWDANGPARSSKLSIWPAIFKKHRTLLGDFDPVKIIGTIFCLYSTDEHVMHHQESTTSMYTQFVASEQ